MASTTSHTSHCSRYLRERSHIAIIDIAVVIESQNGTELSVKRTNTKYIATCSTAYIATKGTTSRSGVWAIFSGFLERLCPASHTAKPYNPARI